MNPLEVISNYAELITLFLILIITAAFLANNLMPKKENSPKDSGGRIFDTETKLENLTAVVDGLETRLDNESKPKEFDSLIMKPVSEMSTPELVREQFVNGEILEAGRAKVKELKEVFFNPLIKRDFDLTSELQKRKSSAPVQAPQRQSQPLISSLPNDKAK